MKKFILTTLLFASFITFAQKIKVEHVTVENGAGCYYSFTENSAGTELYLDVNNGNYILMYINNDDVQFFYDKSLKMYVSKKYHLKLDVKKTSEKDGFSIMEGCFILKDKISGKKLLKRSIKSEC